MRFVPLKTTSMSYGGYVQIHGGTGFAGSRSQIELAGDQDVTSERAITEKVSLKQKLGMDAPEDGSILDWKHGATIELRDGWRQEQHESRSGIVVRWS